MRNLQRARARAFTRVRNALALAVMVGCSSLALSQAQNTGTIAGNVKDAQGGAIVQATITVQDTVSNAARTVHSNAKGEYLFSGVSVGTYTLTVTAPGFEAYVVTGLQLDADQNVRQDARMPLGSVKEQINVESQGSTVDTRSATLGMLLDKQLVENLPVDGNNVVSLAALLPGVSNVNAPTTFTSDTGGPTYNISGSRNNQNLFLLDGVLWNNLFYNTGLNYPPPPALQEVSVLLNNYKAQYGRNVGSIMNVLTKSGGNAMHGELWEYIQNRALNAADYISQINPGLVQNQFGATIGGPIRRDKAFYFLSVQDLRAAQIVFARSETLTAQERGYDVAPSPATAGTQHMCQYPGFSGMQCANFQVDFPATTPNYSAVLRNPLESSTYAGGFVSQVNAAWQQSGGSGNSPCYTLLNNLFTTLGAPYNKNYLPFAELPSACFNPVSVAFLNKYIPYPNAVNAAGFPQTNSTAKQPRNDWDGLSRFDLMLGRHTLDARFYITNANDVTSNSAVVKGGLGGVANYDQDANSGGIYAGNIGDTFVLSPQKLNVLRLGYKRYNYTIYPTDPTTAQNLGSNLVQPATVPSLPEIEIGNRFVVGSTNSTYSFTVNENEELDDSFTWTHGNHNYQFGVQYLHLQYLHRFDSTPFLEAGLSYTEANASDFLAGLLAETVVANSTNLGAKQNDLYMYGQDDWRITSRLTLNYGLRYELPFAWHSADGQGVTFAPGVQSQMVPSAPLDLGYEGDPGRGNAGQRTHYNNLAPRFGFAYDVFGTGTTSIRGGIGIFYDAINASVVGVGAPYHYAATYLLPPGGLSQPLLGESPIAPNYTKGSTFFGTPYSVNFADPNLTTPYTESVNLGVQQRILHSGTLEVNYVGKFGRHQIVQFDLNSGIYQCSGPYYTANPAIYCPASTTLASQTQLQRVIYPGYAYGGQGIVDNASIGSSNYNALQITYTQRARKRLSLLASYTYSKSLDIQSNGQTTSAAAPIPSRLSSQYAASDFDATQIFNLGWVYNLPKTAHLDRPLRAVINGWVFGGIYNARTGQPINITISGDESLTGDRPQRPLAVPGQSPTLPGNRHRVDKVAEWFNTAAFTIPALGAFGNVGRNSVRGPAFIATHFSLARIFPLPRHGASLNFKVDAFNVFNTPNLANPSASLSNSTSNTAVSSFGVVQATVGTNGNVGTNGRRLQISLVLRY